MTGGRQVGAESPVDSHTLDAYSRSSKTNRVDSENGRSGSSLHRALSTRLTERDGVALRRDVRDWNDLHRDSAVTWREAVQRYRQYIKDKEDVAARARVGRLALTHVSSRHAGDVSRLEAEAVEVFGANAFVPRDGQTVRLGG